MARASFADFRIWTGVLLSDLTVVNLVGFFRINRQPNGSKAFVSLFPREPDDIGRQRYTPFGRQEPWTQNKSEPSFMDSARQNMAGCSLPATKMVKVTDDPKDNQYP